MHATASINSDAADLPSTVASEDDVRLHGVRSLQAVLERSLQEEAAAHGDAETPTSQPAAKEGTTARRVIKIALGLGLVATLG